MKALRTLVRIASVFLYLPAANGTGPLTVVAKQYVNTFSARHPVLAHIRPAELVHTKTLDSYGRDEHSNRLSHPPNPLTGPFYVDGAEPGDALLVHFNKLSLNRNWGEGDYRLGLFALAPESIPNLYPNHYKMDLTRPGRDDLVIWDIDLARQRVHLRGPVSSRVALDFAVHPMLGCAGVAPEGDFEPTSGPAGPYGGNMDFNMVAEGATLILPVYHPGAYLFLGDGHALMGEGEASGGGVETSMDVEFTVEVRKNARLTGPRLENSEYLVAVGCQPDYVSSLDRALRLATSDMIRWLTEDYHLEPWAAHILIAMKAQYHVVTVAGSMALLISKADLAGRSSKR